MQRSEFCNVELGLHLLTEVAPQAAAKSLWVLLTGYTFPLPESINRSAIARSRLENGRQLLSYFSSRYQWEAALKRYRLVEDRLRAFDIDEELDTFTPREVSVAADRIAKYQAAIAGPVPYREDRLRWAVPGKYRLPSNGVARQVAIPAELAFAPPDGHVLRQPNSRESVRAPWDELLDTARWMEQRVPQCWEAILKRVNLDVVQDSALKCAEYLEIDGLAHMIGMVSSGKSTLMDVVTVWAARKGLHVTVVVDDVISALSRAQLFHNLGFRVAPVLGRLNREKHLNRLHSIIRESQPDSSPFSPAHDHLGFRWLSTACPLNGLLEYSEAFPSNDLPCIDLTPIAVGNSKEEHEPCACPIYSRCPVHNAQRELVDAQIWVSTPAGLVFARVAQQLNRQRIRFLELACKRSALIIIDEADRVQMQLDSIFSPTETLVSPEGGWLDRLSQRVTDAKARTGRGQLADRDVSQWVLAHHAAQGATDRIAALLQQERDIADWVSQRDYFTGWLLLNRLANDLIAGRKELQRESPEKVSLPDCFQEALDDMTAGCFQHGLSMLALRACSSADVDDIQDALGAWINKQDEFSVHEAELPTFSKRLELALLVALLQSRLNVFIRDWKIAEDPLKLSGDESNFFFRPPRDYEAVIPSAPMGNVLAFQYLPPEKRKSGPGELRFLRCMGVGRWLLLHLHELFAGDAVTGPNVMLLSGTSWSGDSPSYDLQAPVTAVLQSPNREVDAISQSVFEFLPFYTTDGKPIRISGRFGQARLDALRELLRKLCERGSLGKSRLERERNQLDEGRKRILLLVGSYKEAAFVREQIQRLRPDLSKHVLDLVPDDFDFDNSFDGGTASLKRGQVDQLRNRDAWILVAPLLAIERGHNILNDQYVAALGAAYFLVRIHPPPDDISFAIQSINRWAINKYNDASWLADRCKAAEPTLDAVGEAFRSSAYREWRNLLRLQMIYSTLPADQRTAVTWNLLVTVWQVIGRLIRGGQAARVYFCDAAFAPRSAEGENDTASTSLLVGMQEVLRPYFDVNSEVSQTDRELASTLYGPLYSALKCLRGIQHG
jgi:hypothetical protein